LSKRHSQAARIGVPIAWVVAGMLPLIGLVSLILRREMDPNLTNYRLHFVLFTSVAIVDFMLAYATGEAAGRRGDARVLLISLGFLATGAFLGLHAVRTPGVLFSQDLAGFSVAIPLGLLIVAALAVTSAFIDLRPTAAAAIIRREPLVRWAVLGAAALWFGWTVAKLPPLRGPSSEGARRSLLAVLAGVAAAAYAVAAARYYAIYRKQRGLLPASIIACFVLLAEAMIGVAVTGEGNWHASWWEWHGLIVLAFAIVVLAARREWREDVSATSTCRAPGRGARTSACCSGTLPASVHTRSGPAQRRSRPC
jgi:hypothetical protein